MTADCHTARKALSQLISTVEGDHRYYPKAKCAILCDLKIVSDCLDTDTITTESVQASQRLRVNLYRFRPSVSAAKDSTVFLYSLVWPMIEGSDPLDLKTVRDNMPSVEEYRQ